MHALDVNARMRETFHVHVLVHVHSHVHTLLQVYIGLFTFRPNTHSMAHRVNIRVGICCTYRTHVSVCSCHTLTATRTGVGDSEVGR